MSRRFGFECELTSGAQAVIGALYRGDLAGMDSLHSYHCSCSDCRHNDVEANGGFLFRGQTDCTCDGEIISSVLTHGAPSAERAFSNLSKVLLDTRAEVDTNAGFHVHVDKRDMDPTDTLRLYRMFMRYQDDGLSELASARERAVREYNRPVREDVFAPNVRASNRGQYSSDGNTYLDPGYRPADYHTCGQVVYRGQRPTCCNYCMTDHDDGYIGRAAARQTRLQAEWDALFATPVTEPTMTPAERFWTDDTFVPGVPPKGYWLNGFGAGNGNLTFEFRLWNATRVEWRMRLAVGVSVAMVDAAKAGVTVVKDDPRTLEEVLDPYLSDDTWASIIRQRSFKDV